MADEIKLSAPVQSASPSLEGEMYDPVVLPNGEMGKKLRKGLLSGEFRYQHVKMTKEEASQPFALMPYEMGISQEGLLYGEPNGDTRFVRVNWSAIVDAPSLVDAQSKPYVDSHLSGKAIDQAQLLDKTFLVYDKVANVYRNTTLDSLNAAAIAAIAGLESSKLNSSMVGVPGGVATLNPVTGKLTLSQVPETLLGALKWKGVWDANIALPTPSTGNEGWYFIVSVSDASYWRVGDWAVSDGVHWNKIDSTDQVTSVFGRQGPIELLPSDISSALGFTPADPSTLDGKKVDSRDRTDGTIPVFDYAKDTYFHKEYVDKSDNWDGSSTKLVAATGRASLGASTVGSNLFTLASESSVTFPRVNADDSVSLLDAASFRDAIGGKTYSLWVDDGPPLSPSALNSEFLLREAGVPAGWTGVNWSDIASSMTNPTPSARDTFQKLAVSNRSTGSTSVHLLRALVRSIPVGDFSIFTKVHGLTGLGYCFSGLILSSSDRAGEGQQATISLLRFQTQWMCHAYTWSGFTLNTGVISSAQVDLPGTLWLRIRKVGTTYYFGYSLDGTNYTEVGATPLSFVPTFFGLSVDFDSTSASDVAESAFDYFRYYPSGTVVQPGCPVTFSTI